MIEKEEDGERQGSRKQFMLLSLLSHWRENFIFGVETLSMAWKLYFELIKRS